MPAQEQLAQCNGIQVRISALQQANGALMAEAAKAHSCPEEPSALGRSIQDAIALLQDSPILRERSKNSSNIRRPSSAPGVLPLSCVLRMHSQHQSGPNVTAQQVQQWHLSGLPSLSSPAAGWVLPTQLPADLLSHRHLQGSHPSLPACVCTMQWLHKCRCTADNSWHAGQPQATGVPASSKAPEKSPPPKRPTPAKPVVKRIGGGYSMKAAAAAQPTVPKVSPLSKQIRPVSRFPCSLCSQPCLLLPAGAQPFTLR